MNTVRIESPASRRRRPRFRFLTVLLFVAMLLAGVGIAAIKLQQDSLRTAAFHELRTMGIQSSISSAPGKGTSVTIVATTPPPTRWSRRSSSDPVPPTSASRTSMRTGPPAPCGCASKPSRTFSAGTGSVWPIERARLLHVESLDHFTGPAYRSSQSSVSFTIALRA